jgi:uroporphyrinogen-III decarboxylase
MPKVIDPKELKEFIDWSQSMTVPMLQRYREHDYVVMCGGLGSIPFEHFCGGRSMEKFYFDLYRIPDKVQAAMDAAFPEMIDATIGVAKLSGRPGVWLGGWRAASGLLAPKLWDHFVWPYYLRFANALVNAGLTPVLHWDQDWTRDLVRLQELPSKKCILNPDGMTDMEEFKKLAGDRMAMMGDVPASLLSTGTPDDVHVYVRKLVSLFNSTGLIISSGCDIPIDAKPENVRAMVDAAHESG